MTVIISEKFVAGRLSSVYSAEALAWRPPFWRRSQCTHSWDKMADKTGYGLMSTGDRKAFPRCDKYIIYGGDYVEM